VREIATRASFARRRRLRAHAGLRRLVRETRVDPGQLVLPIFVSERVRRPEPISTLPGHFHWPPEDVGRVGALALERGLGGVLCFGLPASKDAAGSAASDEQGVVQRALRTLARDCPGLPRFADVCLCEYTDHGHCGLLRGDGGIDNDASIERLAEVALSLAHAGADVVAPSDMLDGRVRRIRETLDGAGLLEIPILSYAAKYASAFYGPFRVAAASAPAFGDRASYQMDPANGREALLEMAQDLDEGADALMVKPALAYLDVLASARQRFDVPLVAYNVSGEYAMVTAAARAGLIDEPRAVVEILTAIVRAGADAVVSYHALEAAEWLSAA
jgi:porphobilinogen synthase